MKSLNASERSKKTKFGMIPVDWAFVRMQDIAIISSGGTPSRSVPEYWDGAIPWIKTTHIQNCIIHENDVDEWITEEGLKKSSANLVPKGTILLGMIGQGKTRGQVGFLNFEACKNQNAATIQPNDICNNRFLFQYLLLNYKNIRALSNSSGQGNLNLGLVKSIKVFLPPLSEQEAITNFLFIWDESIEKTEKLIRAKEKMFVQLLNDLIYKGRSNCSWKSYKLGDICIPISRKNTVNETNVLTSSAKNGLVSQLDYYKKSVSSESLSGYYLLKKGDFAYNRSSAKGYPFGATKRMDRYDQGVLSTLYLCFSLKPDVSCESDFLLHLFESGSLNRELRTVCQEGARSHGLLNITKSAFYGIRLFLPSSKKQNQIVAVLNTAQKEIDLLKNFLGKYRTQKLGLMQKLLTGEWRMKAEVKDKYKEN